MSGTHIAALAEFLKEHLMWMDPNLHEDQAAQYSASEEYIRHILIGHMECKKQLYEFERRSHDVRVITCDHTFKISANVGCQRGDGAWTVLFDSLFVVMNSEGHVLDHRMVATRGFDSIRPLLLGINQRLMDGQRVEMVVIDNCCQWSSLLADVLGPHVQVKLDVFHAVQRLTKCMDKQHPHYHRATSDLRLCFRHPMDKGTERTQCTASADVMRERLLDFQTRWGSNSCEEMPVLLSDFQHELNCLLKHVDNKCLENIPPGYGTSRNERLHRTLNNSAANVPRIGPQLMDALLTLIFYAWNRRRSGNPVLPVDRLPTSEGKWGVQCRFRLHQWCLQKLK